MFTRSRSRPQDLHKKTSFDVKKVSIGVGCVALFVVWWQPLFLVEPRRATMEALYYTVLILNFYSGSQSTGNALDRFTLDCMIYNNKNIPPAEGLMAREEIAFIEAADYTPEAFHKAWQNGRRPVVVRGLFAESKAVRAWNPEYFKNVTGTSPVKALQSRPECLEAHINAVDTRRDMPHKCYEISKFGDFLDRMKEEKLYTRQVSNIFSDHPPLMDDLELHRLHEEVYPLCKNVLATAFFGHGGDFPMKTTYHAAAADNFLIQVQGHKEWNILPPKWTPYFLTYFYDDTPAVGTLFSIYKPETYEQYSYDKFPASKVVLNPGDLLFVPPWWFHQINHPYDEFHVAVGLRGIADVWKEYVPGVGLSWANSIGTAPVGARALARLFLTGQDWGSSFYHEVEKKSS